VRRQGERTQKPGRQSRPGAGPSKAPRLSLVVLPFVKFRRRLPEHDRFIDGISETLTTDLSRRSGVFVISRSSAFAYKGKNIDTRQIGRELGVRYVLEGSIQNSGNRMRVNAQLVDAESGAHLWAERFDKPCADVLDVQDEVTSRLVRTIHIELIAAESRRATREHPERLDSVDHTLHGMAAWNEPLSLAAARRARHFFEAALQLDENNVGALLGFANGHMWEVNMYGSDDRAGQIRVAEAAATKALALAPDSADAHNTYGTVLFAQRAPDRALREFELAVSLDGNLAAAHGHLGLMKFFLGRRRNPGPCRGGAAAQPARSAALPLDLLHRRCRRLSRPGGSRAREPAQIGRDQPELGTLAVCPGRRLGACRPARGGRRGLRRRAAPRAQLHHRQVPRRGGERQPGLSRAARALL